MAKRRPPKKKKPASEIPKPTRTFGVEQSEKAPSREASNREPDRDEPTTEQSIDWTSTRKRKQPLTDDGKSPLERFLETQKNAPPESDEDRRRRQDEELQSR